MSQATINGFFPFFLSMLASFPAIVVLPEPCKPASIMMVGGFDEIFNPSSLLPNNSTNSSCTDVWSNYYYNPVNETNRTSNEWPCKYDNYNYKSSYHQWSLSPYSNSKYSVWYVNSTGYFNHGYANSTYGVRPAFYLKSQISLTGEGTTTAPYSISNM